MLFFLPSFHCYAVFFSLLSLTFFLNLLLSAAAAAAAAVATDEREGEKKEVPKAPSLSPLSVWVVKWEKNKSKDSPQPLELVKEENTFLTFKGKKNGRDED